MRVGDPNVDLPERKLPVLVLLTTRVLLSSGLCWRLSAIFFSFDHRFGSGFQKTWIGPGSMPLPGSSGPGAPLIAGLCVGIAAGFFLGMRSRRPPRSEPEGRERRKPPRSPAIQPDSPSVQTDLAITSRMLNRKWAERRRGSTRKKPLPSLQEPSRLAALTPPSNSKYVRHKQRMLDFWQKYVLAGKSVL